jgi:hypothetical protein
MKSKADFWVAISQYNDAKPTGPKNISMVIAMRIK